MTFDLKGVEVRFHEESDETWVKLVLIRADGVEVVICDTICDASTIRCAFVADTHERETN